MCRVELKPPQPRPPPYIIRHYQQVRVGPPVPLALWLSAPGAIISRRGPGSGSSDRLECLIGVESSVLQSARNILFLGHLGLPAFRIMLSSSNFSFIDFGSLAECWDLWRFSWTIFRERVSSSCQRIVTAYCVPRGCLLVSTKDTRYYKCRRLCARNESRSSLCLIKPPSGSQKQKRLDWSLAIILRWAL